MTQMHMPTTESPLPFCEEERTEVRGFCPQSADDIATLTLPLSLHEGEATISKSSY